MQVISDDGDDDVWYCILPKLTPLELILMSFVCKTFKEWLRDKMNSPLYLTFLVQCQPCGSCSDHHDCEWASAMSVECCDLSEKEMVKQIWKYHYTIETHIIKLIDLSIVERSNVHFWTLQSKKSIELYWSHKKALIASSTWFLIFNDGTYGFYVHKSMHHNAHLPVFFDSNHSKGFYVENQHDASRIQNARLHWKKDELTDRELLDCVFLNKHPSF